ncbi:3-isopropylmalate dehydrogenase [Paramaledivibacter caminithermalis]|jgi:3-isopropylmalate dehydrogenase|uniref:3-isopropylmalate dehydrogenase n=1 Tax=Paramaledivibacter caminithermalis (strain DSM 15212 / CIP 107654 / DViRD3) TaxID=1121301 RepID=A0A1M6KL86_PARC5|nr:3-isopropylmalate dehydrogenase [Paramaledivibacter caminithermalis]SHJ59742.1 3-isopropylmalate dehydrogenase [Paramaledivibacter caminithermalis DSM 15212]
MTFNIAVIPGDGIGPEVTKQALLVLEKIGKVYGHSFNFIEALAGGCAYDLKGTPLPQETIDICKNSDSVILGAVGGPKWDNLPGNLRPEKGLLQIRKELGLYANIRPAVLFSPLKEACPLKPQLIEGGFDICVVRELTGGMYFGEKGRKESDMGEAAYDTELYSVKEVERIAKKAFEIARKRGSKVTNIDKMNVLESSRLWREVVNKTHEEYPDVTLNHLLVDNAAMQLIRDPKQFDVVVTTNMFGDILSDEASMLTGSIGMLPSASLGEGKFGLYEPIHGSAPDIAGQDKANPLATILSVAMMLRYSFDLEKEASSIEAAVQKVLTDGYRTGDIYNKGTKLVGTAEMGRLVVKNLK